MLHFDHRGLLLFIFVDPGHTRRFIPIPGNNSKCFTDLCIYTTVNDIRYFFRHSRHSPGCSAPGMVAADCLSRKNKKTIAFGNNIIAFVTSTMREKVMGRQNAQMYFVSNTLIVNANVYEKGRLIFLLFPFINFLTAAKLIRKGLVDKGKKKNIFPREENP